MSGAVAAALFLEVRCDGQSSKMEWVYPGQEIAELDRTVMACPPAPGGRGRGSTPKGKSTFLRVKSAG